MLLRRSSTAKREVPKPLPKPRPEPPSMVAPKLPPKSPKLEIQVAVAPFEGRAVMQPFFVRIRVAAQMLGIGRTKVYHLIKRGELETIKLDGSALVTMKSINAFVQRCARSRPAEGE